jgi:hypothetical protein
MFCSNVTVVLGLYSVKRLTIGLFLSECVRHFKFLFVQSDQGIELGAILYISIKFVTFL